MQIHDRMWDIHPLTQGEISGSVITMQMREKTADLLRECRELDLEAAECIGKVV